jgi:glycosyltransferase involved in cell wall biosynthesis
MRVLYFTRDYTPHDHRFLTALAESPHQVYSLRLERRGMQREDRSIPSGIEQIQWKGGKKPWSLSQTPALLADLDRIIATVKPDLIHAGTIQTAAFLTAIVGFRPLVSMSWGSDLLKDADRNAFWTWATQFTLKRTAVLVGDCQAVADKAVSFGFPADRIVTFPWGVDLSRFLPPEQREPVLRSDFRLLSVRSWEPIYGVDVLANAFVRAAHQIPDLTMLLAGGGSQAALIRQILADGRVLDRVTFVGHRCNNELVELYRSADLYLSASYSDGSSVSLMEALACGLPALISDIPGNQEWITPGEQGWLFRTGDVDDLTNRIVYAAEHRAETALMRQPARALAERRADWQKNFCELLRAYEMAVQFNSK